jgi:hypothetical protein
MIVVISLVITSACSKSSDTTSAAATLDTSITGVISTATEKITEGIPGGDVLASSVSTLGDIGAGYGSTDIQIFGSGYFNTPQTFVQYLLNKAEDLDPGDGMGLINRFKQKIVSGMCPIIGLHPDANSDGIPDIGSGTFVLPNFSDSTVAASIVAKCPGANAASLNGASGVTIGYAVTDVSALAGSEYSIKSVIDFCNNGSTDNILYYKADGSVIRFAFVEVDTSIIESAALFEFDGTTLRFDFHGGGQDGHYRMLYDGSTRDISLYGMVKKDASNKVYMSMVGNRKESLAAVTLSALKANVAVVSNGQACVTVTGDTFPWDSNFSSGACGTIVGSDFATAPAVAALSDGFDGSLNVSVFDHTDKILFSTPATVLTSAIIQ